MYNFPVPRQRQTIKLPVLSLGPVWTAAGTRAARTERPLRGGGLDRRGRSLPLLGLLVLLVLLSLLLFVSAAAGLVLLVFALLLLLLQKLHVFTLNNTFPYIQITPRDVLCR